MEIIAKQDYGLLTKVSNDDLREAWRDKFGALYSKDRKRLLKVKDELFLTEYTILDGTEIICDKAFSCYYNYCR